MNSIVIIFAVFALHLSSIRGDMLVRSQTYNISATAVDKHGKLIKVRGSMIDFKLLYVEPEDQAKSDFINFNVAVNEQDGTNTDLYKLNGAFPTSSSIISDTSSTSTRNTIRGNSRPFTTSSTPSPVTQPHNTAEMSVDSVPTAKFDKNSGQKPSSYQTGELSPQGSPLKKPQPYPLSSGAQSSNSVPTQTFQTFKHPYATPAHQNVFDRNNPETRQQGGPRVDDAMIMPPVLSHRSANLGDAQYTHDGFTVQNVSLTPTNGMTSMNLVPIRGHPWSSENKGDSAQVLENAPNLDLQSQLHNISVVSSNDEASSTNPPTTTSTYATLDAASLLRDVDPVNEKVTSDLVHDYLIGETNVNISPSDMAMMQDIVQEVDRIMNDQSSLNVPQAAVQFVPVSESTSTEAVTTEQQPTTVHESTTNSNGSMNSTTCNMMMNMKTETPSSSITVTPSALAILVFISVLVRTVTMH